MTFGQGSGNYAAEAESVAQRVLTRLGLIKDEWFLDIDAGTPYLQEIVVKPVNLPLVDSIIKSRILGTVGVQEITRYVSTLDVNTRIFTIDCDVTNVFGTTENIRTTI
jgi:hypothetical protein